MRPLPNSSTVTPARDVLAHVLTCFPPAADSTAHGLEGTARRTRPQVILKPIVDAFDAWNPSTCPLEKLDSGVASTHPAVDAGTRDSLATRCSANRSVAISIFYNKQRLHSVLGIGLPSSAKLNVPDQRVSTLSCVVSLTAEPFTAYCALRSYSASASGVIRRGPVPRHFSDHPHAELTVSIEASSVGLNDPLPLAAQSRHSERRCWRSPGIVRAFCCLNLTGPRSLPKEL
jgi:hypothetical protein